MSQFFLNNAASNDAHITFNQGRPLTSHCFFSWTMTWPLGHRQTSLPCWKLIWTEPSLLQRHLLVWGKKRGRRCEDCVKRGSCKEHSAADETLLATASCPVWVVRGACLIIMWKRSGGIFEFKRSGGYLNSPPNDFRRSGGYFNSSQNDMLGEGVKGPGIYEFVSKRFTVLKVFKRTLSLEISSLVSCTWWCLQQKFNLCAAVKQLKGEVLYFALARKDRRFWAMKERGDCVGEERMEKYNRDVLHTLKIFRTNC